MTSTAAKYGLLHCTIFIVFLTLGDLVSVRGDVAPEITVHPASQTALEGDVVTLGVTATGGSLYYQWRHGVDPLANETNDTLVLPNVTYEDAGSYSVTVSNTIASVMSTKAVLTVVSKAVWSWGNNEFGQATPPPGLSEIVAATAGGVHTVALRRDGTVVAWGLNGVYGYTDVPPGLSNVVAVSAGFYHSLALKADGTIAGWGETEVNPFYGAHTWTNMSAVAAGWGSYSLGLRTDGTVSVVGDTLLPIPSAPQGLSNVTAIAAADGYYLTLLGDGTVLSWGSQTYVPPWLNNVVAVSCGANHKVALRNDGTVVAWGDNASGQTNVPAGLNHVLAVTCGANHTLALLDDGQVVAWGQNSLGQTNVPSYVRGVGAIGAGSSADHSLAVPAEGAPFITTRFADQTWGPASLPNSIFFRAQATGEWPLRYKWQRNGVDLQGQTNAVLELTNPIDKQGDYRVIIANALGSATSAPAKLLITVPQAPLEIAINKELTWSTGGAAVWFTQSEQSRDGSAHQSGAITNNQQSWLETTVAGPTPISFWWKVSSEPGYDFLEFSVDGVLQPGRISGETDWQRQTHTIPAGAHTLRWRYIKDLADSAGQDAGWLDQVSVTGQATLTFIGTAGTVYNVYSSTDVSLPAQNWTLLGAATEIAPGFYRFIDPEAASAAQRYYRVTDTN